MRCKRNKAQYSLDAGDGIENHIVEFEPSAQELLDRKERFMRLCRALNSLPPLRAGGSTRISFLEKASGRLPLTRA